jgi:predicted glycoside hydrolase/deacetylase ChbG (UPF0249 family)
MEKHLIVCADDFGYSPGINKGIIKAINKGIVTSSSVLVNTNYQKEVQNFNKANQQFDLGLHLFFKKDYYLNIYESFYKQYKIFIKLYKRIPTHFSLHRSKADFKIFNKFKKQIYFYLSILGKKEKIHIRGKNSLNYSFKASLDFKKSETDFINILKRLRPGINQLIIHPGSGRDSVLKSSYPAALRYNELRVLTSKKILVILEKENIKLTNFNIHKGGVVK